MAATVSPATTTATASWKILSANLILANKSRLVRASGPWGLSVCGRHPARPSRLVFRLERHGRNGALPCRCSSRLDQCYVAWLPCPLPSLMCQYSTVMASYTDSVYILSAAVPIFVVLR